MTHILVVDDEQIVLESIQAVLEDSGFSVSPLGDSRMVLDLLRQESFDLVVLDVIMPEIDGIEVCRRIRADPYLARLPIIFLTAKGRPNDIARGLDVGGDDYVTKPFEVIELPARIRALLRRVPGAALDPGSQSLTAGKLTLYTSSPEACLDGKKIPLTPIEHQILHYLLIHAGQPISTEQLLQDIWDYPPGTGDPGLVRFHIKRLRDKIESEPQNPRYLLNIYGRGYLIKK